MSGRGVERLFGPTLLRVLLATVLCWPASGSAASNKSVSFETIGARPASLTTFAVAPSDHDVLYLGTATGEVFVSTDAGRTWSEATLKQLGAKPSVPAQRNATRERTPFGYSQALALDIAGHGPPGNSIGSVRIPGRSSGLGDLYGESVYSSWFSCSMIACFPMKMKSYTYFVFGDWGGGRLSAGAPSALPSFIDGPAAVKQLVVHPHKPAMAFAATAQGVFRTRDHGNNWTRVFVTPLSSDASTQEVWFAGYRLLVRAGESRYVSDDHGERFELATGSLAVAARPEADNAEWQLGPQGLALHDGSPVHVPALISARHTMARDPGLAASIQACLEYLGTAPDVHAAMADDTRWLVFVPQFHVAFGIFLAEGYGRVFNRNQGDPDVGFLFGSYYRTTDNSRPYFAFGLDWKLGRAIMPSGAAGRGKDVEGLHVKAARLSAEMRLLYSERLRLLAQIEAATSAGRLTREKMNLRLEYLTARIDGMTGGLWTESL